MADISVPKSDKGFYLNFTVKDNSGTVYNLTGYTIKLKVWKLGKSDAPTVDAACNIVSAVGGTCRYLITATDFIVVGLYQCELELTKTGVVESTKKYTLEVTESA